MRNVAKKKSLFDLYSFIYHREEDPLILSCAGSFSEEGALSIWQRQREEVSKKLRAKFIAVVVVHS